MTIVWEDVDPRFPRFAVLFADCSPEGKQPLKTELRVASCEQNLDAFANDWLATFGICSCAAGAGVP